jgi:hypothetical protein
MGIVALLAAGCGRGVPPRANVAEEAYAPERDFATGPVEIVYKESSGVVGWTVTAKESTVTLASSGKVRGSLVGVSAVLFKGGKPSCRLRSDKGEADQGTGVLALAGNVEVVAVEQQTVLRAQRLKWNVRKGLLEAEGGVVVTTESYTIGPYPRLDATADLKRFGTPDHFGEASR